ncbi:hypothetical protein ACQ5JZ_02865 [Streptomyces sp. ZG43]
MPSSMAAGAAGAVAVAASNERRRIGPSSACGLADTLVLGSPEGAGGARELTRTCRGTPTAEAAR